MVVTRLALKASRLPHSTHASKVHCGADRDRIYPVLLQTLASEIQSWLSDFKNLEQMLEIQEHLNKRISPFKLKKNYFKMETISVSTVYLKCPGFIHTDKDIGTCIHLSTQSNL